VDLRSALVGLSPLEIVRVLLREWHGVELKTIEGTDDQGVPLVLRSLADVATSLSPSLREMFARSGEPNADGSFVVLSGWSAMAGGDSAEPLVRKTLWEREVPAEPFDQFLLNNMLHALRIDAPVSGAGRLVEATGVQTVPPTWLDLGSWTSARAGKLFCRFYVTGSALVQHLSSGEALVFGRIRADVEQVWSGSLVDWDWGRLDAMYGPELDWVMGMRQQFLVDDADRSGELNDVFAADPYEVAIERFLLSWYGLVLPDPLPGPGPSLLRRLQQLNVTHRVVGSHNQLLQPAKEQDDRGVRWFFLENQAVWGAGYRGGGENPQIWWDALDDAYEQLLRFSGFRLDEFLFRQLLEEAFDGAPAAASTTASVADVTDALVDFRHVVGQPNDLGGVWTDGKILVRTAIWRDGVTVRVAAHQRADIAESPLRRLGGWLVVRHWRSGDSMGNIDNESWAW
jgi:hypothetical protein